MGYFMKTSYDERSGLMKYQTGLQWAVEAMIGSSFGDVIPTTEYEIIFTIIAMVTGSVLYCKIFSDLERKIQTNQQFSLDINVQIFNLGSPQFLQGIIKKLYPKIAIQYDYLTRPGELAEEFFIINKGKVEIIATDKKTIIGILQEGAYFGEVGILLSKYRSCYVRAMTDCIFMCISKNDFLQILNEFPDMKNFLLKVAQQRLKVTNPNDVDQNPLPYTPYQDEDEKIEIENMNLMRQSTKGLTIQRKKSHTSNNEKSLKIELSNGSFAEDNLNDHDDYLSQDDIDYKENLESPFDYNLFKRIKQLRQIFGFKIIFATENMILIWSSILLTAIFYNLFYTVFTICFYTDLDGWFLVLLEVFSFVIYAVDSLFASRLSTYNKRTQSFNQDSEQIFLNYVNNHLMLDIFSTVPFCNIYDLIVNQEDTSNSRTFVRVLRLLRLLKFERFYFYINKLKKDYYKEYKYFTFYQLFFGYFFLNHIAACIMYSICKLEYESSIFYDNQGNKQYSYKTLFQQMDLNSIPSMTPVISQGFFSLYINFLYWSFCVSTQGSYGDFWAVSPIEKSFQNYSNIGFKIFICFLFAQIAHLGLIEKNLFAIHMEKLESFKHWSKQIGLSRDLKNRISRFYSYEWIKLRGIEDETMLNSYLPFTIKDQILLDEMRFIVNLINSEKKIEYEGPAVQFIKVLTKLLIPQNEFVFLEGDLAQEMYFVGDGIAQLVIMENNRKIILAEFHKNSYFGGLELLNEKPSIRLASVKAKTNTCLYVLSLNDYLSFKENYPITKKFLENLYPQNNSQQVIDTSTLFMQLKNHYDFTNQRQQLQKIKTLRIEQNHQGSKVRKTKFNSLNDIKEDEKDENNKSNKEDEDNDIFSALPQNKQIFINQQIAFSNKSYTEAVMSIVHIQNSQKQNQNSNFKMDDYNCNVDEQIEKEGEESKEEKGFLGNKDIWVNQLNTLTKNNHENFQYKNSSFLKFNGNGNKNGFKKSETIEISHTQNEQIKISHNQQLNNSQHYFLGANQSQQQSLNLLPEPIHTNIELALQKITPITTQEKLELQDKSQINMPLNTSNKQQQCHKEDSQVDDFNHTNLNMQNQIHLNQFELEHQITDDEYSNIQFDFQELNLSLGNTQINHQDLSKYFSQENISNIDQKSEQNLEEQLEANREMDLILWQMNQKNQLVQGEEKANNDQNLNSDKIQFNQTNFLINYDKESETRKNQEMDDEENNPQQNEPQIEQNQCIQNELIQEEKQDQFIEYIPSEDNIKPEIDYDENIIYGYDSLELNVDYSQLDLDLSEDKSKLKIKRHNLLYFKESYLKFIRLIGNFKDSFLKSLINLKNFFKTLEYQVSFAQYYYTILIPLYLAYQGITFSNPILITIEVIIFFIELRNLKKSKTILDKIKEELCVLQQAEDCVWERNFSQQDKEEDRIKRQNYLKNKAIYRRCLFAYQVAQAIPFPLIFDLSELENRRTDYFLIIIQMIRCVSFTRMFNILSPIRKKNIYLTKVIEIILTYIFTNHVFCCILIFLGNIESDFNNSWRVKIPAPQSSYPNNHRIKFNIFLKQQRETLEISNLSIYIHATYWSYVTGSHVGVGDVTGVNVRERAYSIVIMFFTTFLHLYIFGNIATIAQNAAFILKKNLDEKYEQVMFTVKNINLHRFQMQIEAYFNFLWNDFLGLDENEVIQKFPHVLKVEFLKKKYSQNLAQSSLFKLNSWQKDSNIESQLLRFMHTKIYLPSDIIAQAGQPYQDLYILLQGRVEAYQFNGQKAYDFQSGDFFGGSLEESLPLSFYLQAQIICNIGIIPHESLKHIKQIFPEWYSKIISIQKRKNEQWLYNLNFFQLQIPQDNILLTSDNNLVEYKVTQELINHYKSVAANFLELEVTKKNNEDNNQTDVNMDLFKEFNIINEDEDSDGHSPEDQNNQNQVQTNQNSDNFKKSKLLNSFSYSRKSTFYQNYIGYLEQQQDNELKPEKYKNLFIIQNPYGYVEGDKIKKMNMIILNWKYIYKIFLVFDSKFEYFLHPTSNAFYQLQWISLIFSIYSVIFTPIYICYEIELNSLIFFLEIISTFQLAVQIYFDIKTPFYIQGTLVTDTTKIFTYLWKSKNLLQRFIHLLPLNLILWSYSLEKKDNLALFTFLSLARAVRFTLLLEVNNILQRISQLNNTQQILFGIFQSVLYLITCWHYISCIWFWFVLNVSQKIMPESNWILANSLEHVNLNEKIVNSMFFVMSIATTCGYPSMKPNNDYERVFFCLTIYFGDAFIAFGFGKLASQSELLPKVQQEIHSKIIILLKDVYDSWNKTHQQRNRRIEHFYLYKSTTQISAEQDLLAIQPLIPQTLYEQLMLTSKMQFLQNIPMLFKLTKSVYYKDIAQYIERKVFLQNDYVNVKNNTDSDLYFISKGTVKVLSPKEDSILLTLKEGDVFSSITMNKDNKLRLCNTFSSNFTEVVTIKLEYTQKLFQLFPELKLEIVQQTSNKGKKKGYTLNLISNLVNYTDTMINQIGLEKVESILSCFQIKSNLDPELRMGLTNLRKKMIEMNNQNQQTHNKQNKNNTILKNQSKVIESNLNHQSQTPKHNSIKDQKQIEQEALLSLDEQQNSNQNGNNKHSAMIKSIFSNRISISNNLNKSGEKNNSSANNSIQKQSQELSGSYLSATNKTLPPLKVNLAQINKLEKRKQEISFENPDEDTNEQNLQNLELQVSKKEAIGITKLRNLFLKRHIIHQNQNKVLLKEKLYQQLAEAKQKSKFLQLLQKISERRKTQINSQTPHLSLQKIHHKNQLENEYEEEEDEESKQLLDVSFSQYIPNKLNYSTEMSQENLFFNTQQSENDEEDELKQVINKFSLKNGEKPHKKFNFRLKYLEKQNTALPMNKYANIFKKLQKNITKDPKHKNLKQKNNEIFNRKKIYLLFSKSKNFKFIKINNDNSDFYAFLSDSEVVQENENNFNIPTYGSRRMVIGNHRIQRRFSRIGLSKTIQLSLLSNSSLRWGSQLINQADEYSQKKVNDLYD